MRKVDKGTRFVAKRDFEAIGLIHWAAPMTSGFTCRVQAGTVLVAAQTTGMFSLGLAFLPEERDKFEQQCIPEEDRTHPKICGVFPAA
jgi:hypothetical protein